MNCGTGLIPIKDISLMAYNKLLENLHFKLKGTKKFNSYDFLKNHKQVTDTIEQMDVKNITKRNYLNAIIVALKHSQYPNELVNKYVELRDEYNQEYHDRKQESLLSEKQQQNTATMEEINGVLDVLKKEALELMKYKKLDRREIMKIQDYVLLSFYKEIPLRNDVSNLKIISSVPADKNNNYLVLKNTSATLILNKYKTDTKYGQKVIKLSPFLTKLIKKYIEYNTTGYLFVTGTGKPLTKTDISKYLARIFKKHLGKNISSTLLRHIYLTEKYGSIKKEQEEDAYKMGHSVETQQNIYTRK